MTAFGSVALGDDYAPDCQARRCDDCTAGDCVCACHLPDRDVCAHKTCRGGACSCECHIWQVGWIR